MEKILIIFRGLNYRKRGNRQGLMVTINALLAIENWEKGIFDDLKNKNIQYDIAFVTYPSQILNELVDKLKPKYIITEGYENQNQNLHAVKNLMLDLKNEYDRFVICRFDYQYKFKITDWPLWEKRGIIITNPDMSGGLFSDILFIVDSVSIKDWNDSVNAITAWPHQIGAYLEKNNIPFYLMYKEPYGGEIHPLYHYIFSEESYDNEKPFL